MLTIDIINYIGEGNIVKVISFLVALQGMGYFIQSILGLYRRTELKIGVQGIDPNYNIIGVILGLWLIATGIGVWYRKEYAYRSIIIIYSLLIIYGVISIGYLLVNQPLNSNIIPPLVITAIVLAFFAIIIKYIQKNKHEFSRS